MELVDGLRRRRRRRVVLRSIASAGAVAVAGCTGGSRDDRDDADGDGDASRDDDAETEGRPFPNHPVDEPRDPPPERICDAVCAMKPAAYPRWNAQVAHENGYGAFFCTPGCMVGYLVNPTGMGGPATDVAGVWVSEFDSGDLIDGQTAFYVHDDDPHRMDEPMGINPRPFAAEDDALAFVDTYEDRSADDVVRLEEFDFERADSYRPNRVPNSEE